MLYKEFAEIIKYKRELFGYTQKEMAKNLAINISKYSRIEMAKQEPTFVELQLICDILKIDLTETLKKESTRTIVFD